MCVPPLKERRQTEMPGENRDSGVGIYISKNHSAI